METQLNKNTGGKLDSIYLKCIFSEVINSVRKREREKGRRGFAELVFINSEWTVNADRAHDSAS